MKKELMKIKNRLLVYGLVTSIGIGISCCSQEEEKRVDEKVSTEKEYKTFKIKEKRMDYER